MKKMTSWILVLVCLMTFASFTAAEEERPIVTALLATSQLPAEKNSILTELCNRTGIDFQPLMVENTAYEEKFSTLSAAGMLPDIVQVGDYDRLMEMIEFGAILPMNELLDVYGQEIVANIGMETMQNTFAYQDGQIYGIPQQNRYSALMVRQDWLDNLGMEVPTTPEEFYDVAVAFTNNDPDRNGENDTSALAINMSFSATAQFLFTAFGVPYNSNALVDGQVVPYFMHPNYMQAIEFIRKLYSEGLMEADFFTIANLDMLGKLWNGTYGFYYGDPIGTTNNWVVGGRYTEDPQPVMTYTVLLDENGKGGAIELMYTSFTCISSTCKNPEAAMQLLNYVCSEEGNQLVYAGIEGTHWAWSEDGTISYLNEYADSAMHRDDGGYAYFPTLRFNGMERQILTEVTQYGYKIAEEHLQDCVNLPMNPTASADITFDDIEMMAALVNSSGDIQAEYEAFIEEYLKNGGSQWIEQATEIYNASK